MMTRNMKKLMTAMPAKPKWKSCRFRRGEGEKEQNGKYFFSSKKSCPNGVLSPLYEYYWSTYAPPKIFTHFYWKLKQWHFNIEKKWFLKQHKKYTIFYYATHRRYCFLKNVFIIRFHLFLKFQLSYSRDFEF